MIFHKEGFIIVNLKIKFVLDFAQHYVWVFDNKCYNKRTGRFIKQSRSGGSIGYYIDGDFYNCNDLRPHLVRYKDRSIPKFELTQLFSQSIEEHTEIGLDSIFEFLTEKELLS